MAEIIANRYEIIKSIGNGGMANVYLALDRVLNREVAIKILKADMANDPVSLERFSREANASTKISHPNIVDIYDVGEDGNKHYIVMEYIKGYTLKQLIRRRGAIPPREAVWMIKQLSQALLEAHKNGLIHRDIKSQNVLIKDDGTIKLADFGIAILNNSIQITSKDSVLGSVHYLAPELAKGSSATMQSDIYSLGIVMYELLTGDVPFKGDNAVQVALMHVKNELPDVRKFNPDIPQSVVNVLLKATAKDLKDRYSNIALMLKDLNTCLDTNRVNEKPVEVKKKDISRFNIKADKVDNTNKKEHKGFSTLLIVSISLLSIVILFIILLLSGVFTNNKVKTVTVPSVVGLNQVSAIDAIDAAGLVIDYPIVEEYTKDTSKDIVISIFPSEGSTVDKGSKVKLTISSGILSIMEDYTGKNIDNVRNIMPENIVINVISVVDDTKQEGTILKQTGILPGQEYSPSDNLTIYFEVACKEEIHVPSVLGYSLKDAIDILEEYGLDVTPIEVDKSDIDESTLNRYKANTIYKTNPEVGTLIKISEDTSITIYYYEDEQ